MRYSLRVQSKRKWWWRTVKVLLAYLILAAVLAGIALVIMVVLELSFNFDFTAMVLSTILLLISGVDFVRVVIQVPKFVDDGTFIGSKKSAESTAAAFALSVFMMSLGLALVTWMRFLSS